MKVPIFLLFMVQPHLRQLILSQLHLMQTSMQMMQWNLICRAWEKNSFNFYHSHHKKEERKSKWPSDSHLWRVFYAPLIRYMNLISKFSFNAKDLLRQQLLPSWYSSHVLTKAHWTSKFFLHFYMKHIEIIIFFAILL